MLLHVTYLAFNVVQDDKIRRPIVELSLTAPYVHGNVSSGEMPNNLLYCDTECLVKMAT